MLVQNEGNEEEEEEGAGRNRMRQPRLLIVRCVCSSTLHTNKTTPHLDTNQVFFVVSI